MGVFLFLPQISTDSGRSPYPFVSWRLFSTYEGEHLFGLMETACEDPALATPQDVMSAGTSPIPFFERSKFHFRLQEIGRIWENGQNDAAMRGLQRLADIYLRRNRKCRYVMYRYRADLRSFSDASLRYRKLIQILDGTELEI